MKKDAATITMPMPGSLSYMDVPSDKLVKLTEDVTFDGKDALLHYLEGYDIVTGLYKYVLPNKSEFYLDEEGNVVNIVEAGTTMSVGDYTFEKYGSVHVKVDGVKTDVTTLRVEEDYEDFRHPGKIRFVKTIKEDYVRRDFTINAIYIDKDFKIIDPSNGMDDLKAKLIRFIGDPEKRIKEDPLRIIRAIRFAIDLDFNIDKDLEESMLNHSGPYLLQCKNQPQNLCRSVCMQENDSAYSSLDFLH